MRNSITDTLLAVLGRTQGMTKEELALAAGTNSDTVRGLISLHRSKGIRIIDTLEPSVTGKSFFKKRYKIAKTNEEYYQWAIRQLQGHRNIPPYPGSPKY